MPDFDNPGDANEDNVYEVTLTASDGRATASLNLSVRIEDSREGIAVKRIFSGFSSPAAIAVIPEEKRLLVGEKDGSIYYFDSVNNTRSFLVCAAPVDSDGEPAPIGQAGLLALAVSPTFAKDGLLYASFDDRQGNSHVRAYVRSRIEQKLGTNSEPVFLIPGEGGANPALWMGFDPRSGYPQGGDFFVAVGSSSAPDDNKGTAQDNSKFLGKLLRWKANLDPYAGATPIDGGFEIVANGLRQPASAVFHGSALLIADQGQSRYGEINYFGFAYPFTNFGWPFREGTSANTGSSTLTFTEPELQVAFGGGPKHGNAIVMGPYYDGPIKSLSGRVIFGDRDSGKIWTTGVPLGLDYPTYDAKSFADQTLDFKPDVGAIDGVVGFAVLSGGRFFILDRDGELFEVVPEN